MSEPIPESIPTSADSRSHRPLKRARIHTNPNANATQSQASEISNLFLEPERPISLPLPSTTKVLAAPPEIVANVQGSSAGAGSGEFHVYKASRRREYERLRVMDEEAKTEEEERAWWVKEQERRKGDEERTRRNREKRMKKRGKKEKGGGAKENDEDEGQEGATRASKVTNETGTKKAIQVPQRDVNDEEAGINDTGVTKVVEENGITIHDDD